MNRRAPSVDKILPVTNKTNLLVLLALFPHASTIYIELYELNPNLINLGAH